MIRCELTNDKSLAVLHLENTISKELHHVLSFWFMKEYLVKPIENAEELQNLNKARVLADLFPENLEGTGVWKLTREQLQMLCGSIHVYIEHKDIDDYQSLSLRQRILMLKDLVVSLMDANALFYDNEISGVA